MKNPNLLLIFICISMALAGTTFIALGAIISGAVMLFSGVSLSIVSILLDSNERLMSPGIFTNRKWKDDIINILSVIILGSIVIYFLLN